jgi:hypothetical protein
LFCSSAFGNELQVSDGPYPQCVCSSETAVDISYCACVLPAYQDPDILLLAKQIGGQTLVLAAANMNLAIGDCVRLDTTKGYNTVYLQRGCSGNWTEILQQKNRILNAMQNRGITVDDIQKTGPWSK